MKKAQFMYKMILFCLKTDLEKIPNVILNIE